MLGNRDGRTTGWRKQSPPTLWDICTQAVLCYQHPQQRHLTAVAFDVDMLPDEIHTFLAEHWECVGRRFISDNPGNAQAGGTNYPGWSLACSTYIFSTSDSPFLSVTVDSHSWLLTYTEHGRVLLLLWGRRSGRKRRCWTFPTIYTQRLDLIIHGSAG
jgi:hypothetical protein